MLIRRYKSLVKAYDAQRKLALAQIPYRVRISRHRLRGIEYVILIYPVAEPA